MTREEIIDLLTLARVYDGRVTVGKAECAAWFLAVNHIPAEVGHKAVVEHYTAPVEPGGVVQRLAPAHVIACYRSHNRRDSSYETTPALPAAKASPEFVAARRAEIDALIEKAGAAFALDDATPGEVPRWRPGMDKRKLALTQAEASRRIHNRGGAA